MGRDMAAKCARRALNATAKGTMTYEEYENEMCVACEKEFEKEMGWCVPPGGNETDPAFVMTPTVARKTKAVRAALKGGCALSKFAKYGAVAIGLACAAGLCCCCTTIAVCCYCCKGKK